MGEEESSPEPSLAQPVKFTRHPLPALPHLEEHKMGEGKTSHYLKGRKI